MPETYTHAPQTLADVPPPARAMSITEPIGATQTYLDFAEQIAAKRTARQREYADVPPPAAATHVDPWDYDGPNDEIRSRFFYGARRDIGSHQINIIGTQNADGSIKERLISVRAGEDSICFDTPQSTREAAAAMLAAADEWEAALLADKQPSAAMACPLCDGRGDIEADDTVHCAHIG
jgi:hypothetical protein